MAREPAQAPLRQPIEPLHGLRSRRDAQALCGADRRRKRTTSQIDLVTCPECQQELVIEALGRAAELAALADEAL